MHPGCCGLGAEVVVEALGPDDGPRLQGRALELEGAIELRGLDGSCARTRPLVGDRLRRMLHIWEQRRGTGSLRSLLLRSLRGALLVCAGPLTAAAGTAEQEEADEG